MNAQHITQDMRFERANEAIGDRMANPEWLNETWGTKLDCDSITKRMCALMADGDSAEAGHVLEEALKDIAKREVSTIYGVTL